MAYVPSSAVCPGCRQPLPSNLAQGPPQLQCLQCGAVFPNPLVRPTSDPHGTYGEQFRNSPVSTYLFGPQLEAYRAHDDPYSHAHRKRIYLRWWLALLVLVVAALVLPFLCGWLRFDFMTGFGGLLMSLIMVCVWGIGYLIGLVLYGGAVFEKSWLMNSKRAREKRALWGDSKARNIYLWLGRGLMLVCGVIMGGGTLFLCVGLMFGHDPDQPDVRRNPAAPGQQVAGGPSGNAGPSGVPRPAVPSGPSETVLQQIKWLESSVKTKRVSMEGQAARLRTTLASYEKAQADAAGAPGDVERRRTIQQLEEELGSQFNRYQEQVAAWRKSVQNLKDEVQAHAYPSAILDANRELPPSLTFVDPRPRQAAPGTGQAPGFPFSRVESSEETLRRAQRQFGDWRPGEPLPPNDFAEVPISSIESARTFLEETEAKHGYRSPLLAQIPPPEMLTESARAARRREQEKLDAQFPTFPKSAPSRNSPPIAKPTSPRAKPTPPTDLPPFGQRPADNLLANFHPKLFVTRGAVEVLPPDKPEQLQIDGMDGGALVTFNVIPPQTYFVEAQITRRSGDGPLFLALPIRGEGRHYPAVLVVDGGPKGARLTGLEAIRNIRLDTLVGADAPVKGEQLPLDKTVRLGCDVADSQVTLRIDDQVVYHWQGDVRTLSVPESYGRVVPFKLYFGCQEAKFQIERPRYSAP